MVTGRIITHITTREKRARRGQPALVAGSQLYLIQYPNGRYFYCGYTDRKAAQTVMDRLKGDSREIDFNSVSNPEQTMHYIGDLKVK